MTQGKQEVWLQVTAGQGPAECAWAVVRVLEAIEREATEASLEFKTLEIGPGPEPGTAQSALVSISVRSISGGTALDAFTNAWRGTVQFTARSPFRPAHKRKNWFVGVEILEHVEETRFDPKTWRWRAKRASGTGREHANRARAAYAGSVI